MLSVGKAETLLLADVEGEWLELLLVEVDADSVCEWLRDILADGERAADLLPPLLLDAEFERDGKDESDAVVEGDCAGDCERDDERDDEGELDGETDGFGVSLS
jgi:hypothetical protein